MSELQLAKDTLQLAKDIYSHFTADALEKAKEIIEIEKRIEIFEKENGLDKPTLSIKPSPEEKKEVLPEVQNSTLSKKEELPLIKQPKNDLPF